MIAVIFEVWLKEDGKDAYLNLAAELGKQLNKIDGFISVERFQSLKEPRKLLSLSFWRDDEAVGRWRNFEMHRKAQASGRASVFLDYRLRIAAVVRDYGMADRLQVPRDSAVVHD